MYLLKKVFITARQTLIKDVTKECDMEWLAENKVKLTFFMYSFNLLVALF